MRLPCGSPACDNPDCDVEPGMCHCGCGNAAPLAAANNFNLRLVKGLPQRYRQGHAKPPHSPASRAKAAAAKRGSLNPNWKGEKAGVQAIHLWLRRNYPLAGICEQCQQRRKTDFASITGHLYFRHRLAYRELCRSCHVRFDYANGTRKLKKVAA